MEQEGWMGEIMKLEKKMRDNSIPFSEFGVNVKWETTNVRRGQEARLLEEGWEPFAVVQHDGVDYLYLRRNDNGSISGATQI